MIFEPKFFVSQKGYFRISNATEAIAHSCMNRDVIADFWHGFTFRTATLSVKSTDEAIFRIGSTEALALDGYAYSIHVDEDGVCICAENTQNLLLGYMTLLDRIRMIDEGEETACVIDCCQIKDSPDLQMRMVHFCIFPETKLYDLQRFIRFCAALKFSHVVLEFWGMLKYDCLGELAWPIGFSKDEVRPILQEARELGLEIIPMFNHWGHASACRVMHGKHVVLDQNPTLQSYFSEDGWCWDIRKPKVRALLRSIRRELCELCGDGGYFHIGCDEAYNFEMTQENMDFICGFINEVSDEMKATGRRVIAWGDMFLYKYPHYNSQNKYEANAPSPAAEAYLLAHLSRDVVIGDWQYDCPEAPVETAFVFKNAGFDTLLCPWDRSEAKLKSCIKTAKEHALTGVLHTTWHTLSERTFFVVMAAKGCFESADLYKKLQARTHAATVWRKVWFVDGDYEAAGWSAHQIGDITS